MITSKKVTASNSIRFQFVTILLGSTTRIIIEDRKVLFFAKPPSDRGILYPGAIAPGL